MKLFKKQPFVSKEAIKSYPWDQKIKQAAAFLQERFLVWTKELLTIYQKFHDLSKTNYNLAYWHLQQGNLKDAKWRFKLVCHFRPDQYPDAYYQLGRLEIMGEMDEEKRSEALAYFKKALELKPDYVEAKYMLTRLENSKTIDSIPLTITKMNFDNLAPRYEEEIIDVLNYQAHKHLVRAVDEALGDDIKPLRIADLGCGTGLCGIELKRKGLVRQMDGVDISPNMLALCEGLTLKGEPVYDFLINKDLLSFLKEKKEAYDLISAAGVFYYIGNLTPVFEACKEALRPHGLLAFSVEGKAEGEGLTLNSDLDSFSYSKSYVEECAKKAGLIEKSCTSITLYDSCEGLQFVFSRK